MNNRIASNFACSGRQSAQLTTTLDVITSTGQLALAAFILMLSATAAAAPAPPEVLALAARAKVQGEIVAWCSGNFRPGNSGALALAVSPTNVDGRYLVVESDGQVFELGSFRSEADLACYTPAEAIALSTAIASSETVQGSIAPRFPGTVVCAFLEQTSATCWQYSPAVNAFVKVGSWVT